MQGNKPFSDLVFKTKQKERKNKKRDRNQRHTLAVLSQLPVAQTGAVGSNAIDKI
jgi:hypothetical protein